MASLSAQIRKWIPRWVRALRVIGCNSRTLFCRLGQVRSVRENACVNALGEPIPWYTYPAIEYLQGLDFSQKRVFEYGCGNSTRFWAQRAQSVVAVEDNPLWYERVRSQVDEHVSLQCLTQPEDYVRSIETSGSFYDIIVIDGDVLEQRLACAQIARKRLLSGGMIVLDNADWLERTTEYLRSTGLIQVDFSGFGPLNHYAWTTAIFFSRDADFKPLSHRQPQHPVGGCRMNRD